MSELNRGSAETREHEPVAIWDRATRAWHWLIVLGIPAMWLTAELNLFSIHKTLGIVLAGLLVFRLLWAILGSRTSRATEWIGSPQRLAAYVSALPRKGYRRTVGHNPLGGLSVIALFLTLSAQLASGLIAVDTDGLNSGPLARFVSYDIGREAADFHETAFNVLLGLIVLHITAVLAYAGLKRVNLIGSMITGKGRATGEPNSTPAAWRLIAAIAAAGAITYWLFSV